MKNKEQPLFSPKQFLELENTCDRFENRLRQGNPLEIEQVVDKASPEIRRVLSVELESLLEEHLVSQCEETLNPQEHTLTPSPANTQIERAACFDASPLPAANLENQDQENAEGKFGRFQLHSIVGRGGSGVVWRAFDGNLNRWVALKIAHPRSGLDSKRFVREAQAVARLKHPCIIPVFEAGELDGKCFLVSEFCEGKSLFQLTKGQPLGASRAVEIVLSVVEALKHSHEAGIVHRDIKPHNIMIDPDGKPMVTDFGLARNLLHDQTLTLEGELIGTPGYMAPEQATGGANQCDERTDVYSIGVVLFQLLSGQLPFNGSFERVVFQVVNSLPLNLQSIDAKLPREISAICAKCLEKSPDRRYQSAGDLADELRRFLRGQPVETRTISLVGRYQRWIQREPKIAWAATSSVVFLVLAVAGSSLAAWSLNRAWQDERSQVLETERLLSHAIDAKQQEVSARRRAEDAETAAERNADLAEDLAKVSQQEVDFLSNLLAPVDLLGLNQMYPREDGNAQLLSADTIKNAERQVDLLLNDAPVVQARIKGMLANAWRSRGNLDKAEVLLEEATQILVRNTSTDDRRLIPDFAMNKLYWAYLCHHQEDFDRSEKFYRESIQLHKQVEEVGKLDVIRLLQLAQAEFGLGALYLRMRRNEEAEPYLKKALRVRRKHLARGDSLLMATELAYTQCRPKNDEVDMNSVLESIGQDVIKKGMGLYWEMKGHRNVGEFEKASDCYSQLVELIREQIGEDSSLYAMALGDFASLTWDAGNYSEAEEKAMEAIAVSREIAPWHSQRMSAMLRVASEMKLAHRFSEARDLLVEVSQHESSRWSNEVQLNLDLAWCYFQLGDFQRALEHSVKPLSKIGYNTAAETAWISFTHATVLEAAGRSEEAEAFHNQAIETVKKMVRESDFPKHPTWLKRTGVILTHHGEVESAELALRSAIKFAQIVRHTKHPRVATLQAMLAENLLNQGKTSEAYTLIEEVLEIQERCLPDTDIRLQISRKLSKRLVSRGSR